jgi:hypothetical protein
MGCCGSGGLGADAQVPETHGENRPPLFVKLCSMLTVGIISCVFLKLCPMLFEETLVAAEILCGSDLSRINQFVRILVDPLAVDSVYRSE